LNIVVVKNAGGELNKLLVQAKSALRQVEAEVFNLRLSADEGIYDQPNLALEGHLQELHDILLVVLEAAEMPGTRASLIESWREFTSQNGGLRNTIDNNEYQSCASPALDAVERIVQGLQMSVTKGISSEESWTLIKLEEMLWNTAVLVRRRDVLPENEHDIQDVMHDYLHACFPDFRPNPPIGGAIKTFRPDCGIASVRAAIEFKIVHSKEQVPIAFSGVVEDTAAYKGSKDWTRFYAVLYQAEPFISASHLRHDMKRIGATQWITIHVIGPTKKKTKRKV
jgi:hypothetical protein